MPESLQTSNFRLQTPHFKSLRIVELQIPVEIIAPALRRVPPTDGDAYGRGRLRPPGKPLQMHAGLGGRPSSLSPVAADAAGDDILPVFAAAMCHRHHVVEGQLVGGKLVPA